MKLKLNILFPNETQPQLVIDQLKDKPAGLYLFKDEVGEFFYARVLQEDSKYALSYEPEEALFGSRCFNKVEWTGLFIQEIEITLT